MKLQFPDHLPGKFLLSLLVIPLMILLSVIADAQELIPEDSKHHKTIVVGFVGGMRSPDDPTQGVVSIGKRLSHLNYPELQVEIYRHWHWRSAYQLICEKVDRDQNGNLSKAEIALAPKVVIYGHSLGGWAVIKLSRRLEKAGVPVHLTVQIDSVGAGDETIPKNVKTAVNYYQRNNLLLKGEKRIRAEDETRTTIAGNFLIDDTNHESLARQSEISDFITDRVQLLRAHPTEKPGKRR